MIQFEAAKLSDDGKGIELKGHVDPQEWFEDLKVKEIYINTSEQTDGYEPNTSEYVYHKVLMTDDEEPSNFDLKIKEKDLLVKGDLKEYMFIVTVITEGIFTEDTPCGLDSHINMKAVWSDEYINQKGLTYLQELENTCEIPKNFIDYILNMKGFQLSLAANDIPEAIKRFNKVIPCRVIVEKTPCDCYGKNLIENLKKVFCKNS